MTVKQFFIQKMYFINYKNKICNRYQSIIIEIISDCRYCLTLVVINRYIDSILYYTQCSRYQRARGEGGLRCPPQIKETYTYWLLYIII